MGTANSNYKLADCDTFNWAYFKLIPAGSHITICQTKCLFGQVNLPALGYVRASARREYCVGKHSLSR